MKVTIQSYATARLLRWLFTIAAAAPGLAFCHAVVPGQSQQITSPDALPQGLEKSDWASIRAAYEAGRHGFQPVEDKDGQWQALNPGQQWITTFDQRGFTARPQQGGWTWGLQLQSYGFGDAQTVVSGTPAARAEGQRLAYQWDAAVQEWYVNDQRGLEHGFIVLQRPAGADGEAPLRFTLSTRGDLAPDVGAQAVTFQDAAGAAVVSYSGLKVWDADGTVLASRFEPAGERCFRLVVDELAARYPITIDPIAQQAYLKPSNTAAGDAFGYSVAIAGDTVVVGAPTEDSNAIGVNGNETNNSALGAGAAYVFTRSGGTWIQHAYLKASNTAANDNFGRAVAISGDTIVVGAPAEDSIATGVNGNQADNSASASGAAYVFIRSGGTWSPQAYLKASNTGMNDSFGGSVAISGETIVVGAIGEAGSATGVNGNQADNSASIAGAAYVFTRSGNDWSQQAYLKASNTGAGDRFGGAVAISDDTVVVGAYGEGSAASGVNGNQADNSILAAGAAYVFTRSGGTWSQQAYLKASNTGDGDRFGYSVGIAGHTVVVGASAESSSATGVNGNQADNSAASAGAAYIFTRSGGTWSQQAYLKASNAGASDGFGNSVGIAGDTVVVGASAESSSATGVNGNQADNSALSAGAAYVFTRSGALWSQQAYLKASNAGASDQFGWSVAIAGDSVVVGANGEASNATGVNGNGSNNAAGQAGAAYVFTGLGPPAAAPVVAAPTSTDVTATAATLGGNVTSDGGAPVTERGVVYSLTSVSANPLISGSGVTQVTASGTTGVFTVPVSGLSSLSGYSFKAYATNSAGTSYTSVATFTTLTVAPTFSNYVFTTVKDTAASVPGAGILARAADPDGGTPALTAVSAASTQGGSVSLSGGNVNYTPPAGFTGLDTFTVTISDGQGGSVTGTVTVNVTATGAVTQTPAQLTIQPSGNVVLLFLGTPGQVYIVQRSTDLVNWSTLQTGPAAPDGTIPCTDTSPLPGAAFYRSAIP